jgi:dipeptidase D
MKLSHLQPVSFFKHFEAISQIPRGSGNEAAVSDFVAEFARGLGHRVVQDELKNVIIFKPASPGHENKPAVILQGHLDMVCEKNEGTVHDFTKDPLDLYIDGDFVRARGTTLGADNGTAVAYCMAILEDKKLKHPPLEMILTVEEETGMAGAEALDASLFSATRMINLDSSEEDIITIGCAAGVTVEYDLPLTWEAAKGTTAMRIGVGGLHGGHSGGDINKGRGNALVILGCVLAALEKECEIRIASAQGGMKLNAIPREASAVITFPEANLQKVNACISECHRAFGKMYSTVEPTLAVSGEAVNPPKRVMSSDCGDKLIASLLLLPHGVAAMCQDMPDVVAASCNLGVLEMGEDSLKIQCFPRGVTADYLKNSEEQIRTLAKRTGADARFIQRSPAWAYDPSSALLKAAAALFEKQHNKKPIVTAVHAGLECGILAEKIPGLDIIAMGPTVHDLHTPDERMSISSVGRVWRFLLDLLEEM